MYLIILVILITELITVSNGEDNYCMSDCISQRQPSLYEQHCCNLSNIGNTFKIDYSVIILLVLCCIHSFSKEINKYFQYKSY